MGPPLKKNIPARSMRSFTKLLSLSLISKILGYLAYPLCTKIKITNVFEIIYYTFQHTGVMEPGSISCLTSEEAARLVDDAAAAAADAAAAAAAETRSGSASGNGSLPATSGFVHTANPPIPHSERSTLIRINSELKSKPTVLGGGGGEALLPTVTWNPSTLLGTGG
jgi:hypothetical protein